MNMRLNSVGKKHNTHYPQLPEFLEQYAKDNDFFYARYSEYHMRIIQDDIVCFDAWTTAKYYIVGTEFVEYGANITERAGEKGQLPTKKKELYNFLNKLFYPIDFA